MKFTLNIDDKKILHGFVDIQKAQEMAIKNTLNLVAFLVRKNYIKNIKDDFIIRNKFTERQIQVDKAVDGNISSMQSEVGATDRAAYLELQEDGGTKKPKGKSFAIPQLPARMGSKRNLIPKGSNLRSLRKERIKGSIKNKRAKKTYKSKLVARTMMAYQTKKPIIYKKGIFKITGFTKTRSGIHFTKRLIYIGSQKSAKISATNNFEGALEKPIRDFQNIYNSQIRKLLRMKEII